MIKKLSFGFLIFVLLFGFSSFYPMSTNVTHGDKVVYIHSGSFDLHKDVTSKRFSCSNEDRQSGEVKGATDRADHYLTEVNNLNKYNVHISLVSDVGGYASNDTVTESITFIRKSD